MCPPPQLRKSTVISFTLIIVFQKELTKKKTDSQLLPFTKSEYLLPPANEVCEGYVFTRVCHSVHKAGVGGVWVGWGAIPACIAGGIPACLAAGLQEGIGIPACLAVFQSHTQGEVERHLAMGGGSLDPQSMGKLRGIWPGGSPGPQPRWKLRGIWPGGVSRPTPKGEVEVDLAWCGLQAHTWGVPAPGGCLLWRGLLPGGCLLQGGLLPGGCGDPPMMATAAGGTDPTGMHSCLVEIFHFNFFHNSTNLSGTCVD